MNLLHGWWECRGQIVVGVMHGVSLSFPCEIVVVSDRRQISFGNEFRQGQTKRDVHWQGKRVLCYQNVDVKLMDESFEMLFQSRTKAVDRFGRSRGAPSSIEQLEILFVDFGVAEVRLSCLWWI